VTIQTSTDVRRLRRDAENGGWLLADADGRECRFDKVILACPPNDLGAILEEARPDVAALARRIPVIRATCIVHSDLTLMPRHRSYWSFYNYLAHPRLAKPIGTVWSGKKYGQVPVFTSIDKRTSSRTTKAAFRVTVFQHSVAG
jgi:uncharacterized protein